MGLVHHQQVPVARGGLREACGIACQEVQVTEHQLFGVEGITAGILRFEGVAAFLIEDAEEQVEAAQHLHQPLVQEAFRNQDQHAPGTLGNELLVQDHAGLDGLAQAHLVGQQHPWRIAICHLVGDVELVG